MSFQIFWDRLDSGVARTIQERLNARLATLPKPDMIGDLSITDLDLGSVAPHVEILDITDPYPEFYLPETSQAGSDSIPVNSEGGRPGMTTSARVPAKEVPAPLHKVADTSSGALYTRQTEQQHPPPSPPPPPSTVPVSQGSTYSISSREAGEDPGDPPPFTLGERTPPNALNPAIATSELAMGYTPSGPHQTPAAATTTTTTTSPDIENGNATTADPVSPSSLDTQVTLAVSYKGNMSVTVRTSLRLNYPSPAFLELPVVLKLTGFDFAATAVVATVAQRICCTFVKSQDDGPPRSLLTSVYVRSEIGDQSKHVLRNVEKIESFVVNQVRRVIDQDFIFPRYHTLNGNMF